MSKWRPPWHYSSAHDSDGESVAYLHWQDTPPWTRKVFAPGPEMAALDENLSGEEYPLFEPLPQIAHGLPVIDFGAHVGSAAVYFEEMLNPSMVLCYEPSPTAFEYLLKNTSKNAQCINAAIGARAGQMAYTERTPIFTSTMVCGSNHEGIETTVPVVAATDPFDRIGGEVGVLKVDIEGAEMSALMPIGENLKRCRIVFIEYHHEKLRRLIDPIMADFHLFHSHTFDDAWWGQGTLGYLRRDLVSIWENQHAEGDEGSQTV